MYYQNTLTYSNQQSLQYIIPNEAKFFAIEINFQNASNYSEIDYHYKVNNQVIDYDISNVIDNFIYSRYL